MQLTFGQWVQQQRGERDISDCARRAGLHWEAWKRIEKDEPRRRDGSPPRRDARTVVKVAKGLGVSPREALIAAGIVPDDIEEGLPPLRNDDISFYYYSLPEERRRVVREMVKAYAKEFGDLVDEAEKEEEDENV